MLAQIKTWSPHLSVIFSFPQITLIPPILKNRRSSRSLLISSASSLPLNPVAGVSANRHRAAVVVSGVRRLASSPSSSLSFVHLSKSAALTADSSPFSLTPAIRRRRLWRGVSVAVARIASPPRPGSQRCRAVILFRARRRLAIVAAGLPLPVPKLSSLLLSIRSLVG